jgi:hypothetical protein
LHRFAEGTSGNPGGKPKQHRLLSKTLRSMLSDPAPAQVVEAFEAFGLRRGASWAQCISARLIRLSIGGDLDAMRLVGTFTEGALNSLNPLALDDFDGTAPPLMQIVFVDAIDGKPAESLVIEGKQPESLPDAAE